MENIFPYWKKIESKMKGPPEGGLFILEPFVPILK